MGTASPLLAQPSSSRDSLRMLIQQGVNEAALDASMRLAEAYLRDSLDRALESSRHALNLATRLNQTTMQARAYDIIGRAYLLKGNSLLATECFEKGLRLARLEGNEAQIAHLLNSLGVLYSRSGDYEKALALLTESRPMWLSLGDQLRASYLLVNIGSLQAELGRMDQAVRALEEALKTGERSGNLRLQGYAINNLGAVYEEAEAYEDALFYYRKALDIKDQSQRSVESEINTLGNIHNILVELGQDQEAAEVYQEALVLAESSPNRTSLQRLLKQRGDALLKQGAYKRAADQYQQSLALADTFGYLVEQAYLIEKLAATADSMGNHQRAYHLQLRAGEIRQQQYDEESAARMAEVQARYELSEMEKQVATLQAIQRSKELQLLALLALVALFVVALLALYNRYRLRRKTQRLMEQRSEEIERQNQLLGLKNREIQQQNQQLEDQGHAIHAQNQQLLQSNEELAQLAYAASHDLQEPLRTIISYLQLLKRRHGDELAATGQEFLQFATQGASRLQELLHDLLTYSRVGRVQPQPEEVAVDRLMEQVVEHLQSRIHESQAQITWQDLPVVQGFSTELYLLFQNLIGNAIKFRKPDQRPQIHLDARREGGYHLISIADNGIGIDQKHQDRVFQIFQRLHDRETYEGTGIGLTLSQKIVRNHGGRIWFESKVGEGTTFWIKLPLRLPKTLSGLS